MRLATEQEIVVLATREPAPARDAALVAAIETGPDWQQVIDLAHDHGVAPLLAATLRTASYRSIIPAPALLQLDALTTATALKSGALLAALDRLLAALATAGVRPIILKGPALASTLYPDPELRPFNDLDLLCQPEDLAAAATALRRCGYEPRQQKPTEQDRFHVVYLLGGTMVELHSDLLQLGLPTRCGPSLWERTETFTVGRSEALMLGLEHQILHLCVHLHTHGYHRLIWFKDLDRLLRVRGDWVDWAQVGALAEAEGAALSLRHTLTLAHELLGTPVPPAALRGLGWDPLGEAAHALIWPRNHILDLHSKQRLRSVRFNPRLGLLGTLPSLVVMGRRREKLGRLIAAASKSLLTTRHDTPRPQSGCDQIATEPQHAQRTVTSSDRGAVPAHARSTPPEPASATRTSHD